jgi:hypothetical protein
MTDITVGMSQFLFDFFFGVQVDQETGQRVVWATIPAVSPEAAGDAMVSVTLERSPASLPPIIITQAGVLTLLVPPPPTISQTSIRAGGRSGPPWVPLTAATVVTFTVSHLYVPHGSSLTVGFQQYGPGSGVTWVSTGDPIDARTTYTDVTCTTPEAAQQPEGASAIEVAVSGAVVAVTGDSAITFRDTRSPLLVSLHPPEARAFGGGAMVIGATGFCRGIEGACDPGQGWRVSFGGNGNGNIAATILGWMSVGEWVGRSGRYLDVAGSEALSGYFEGREGGSGWYDGAGWSPENRLLCTHTHTHTHTYIHTHTHTHTHIVQMWMQLAFTRVPLTHMHHLSFYAFAYVVGSAHTEIIGCCAAPRKSA